MKWRKFVGILSISTLITLFSGVYVSTTPGANYGCGVDGMLDSWPLCNGKLVQNIENWELQSQIVHRWLVSIVGAMLAFCSYKIWRDCQDGQSGITLRNWVWASTATYFANGLLGASLRHIMGFREFLRVPVASAPDGRNGIIHCSCHGLARSYSYVLPQRSEYYC